MHHSRVGSTCAATTVAVILVTSLFAPVTRAETWKITQKSVGSAFYDHFNFNNITDPSGGRVVYVDQTYAIENNLTYAHHDHFVLRTDYTTVLDPAGPGRPSVRLISKKQYGPHVLVADLRHMPEGCGTWPAIREKGDNQPQGGLLDIMEGRNDLFPNQASLHTAADCMMRNNTRQNGVLLTDNCDNTATNGVGCGVKLPLNESFGPPFNRAGGGFYAMERTNKSIKIWFWPREAHHIPIDILRGRHEIDTKHWGVPDAYYNNDACDIEAKFKPAWVLMSATLCGDWAGSQVNWAMSPCSAQYATCVDYINQYPQGMKDAYFDFKALRIYEAPESELNVDV